MKYQQRLDDVLGNGRTEFTKFQRTWLTDNTPQWYVITAQQNNIRQEITAWQPRLQHSNELS